MREVEIELFVALKGPDLVTLTAKNTLWHELGYKNTLIDLKREDRWAIRILATNPEEIARELVERTKVFVNPNRHTFRIGRERERRRGVYKVGVLISEVEDLEGRRALGTLWDTYGYKGKVMGVEYGVLWSMEIRASDKAEAERLAKEMTLTRSTKKGLLLNPYFQRFRIMWCEPPLIEGGLLSINISAKKGEKKRPIRGTWEVIKGHGLKGDAHCGPWHRQVSLLAAEAIEKMKEKGLNVGPGDFAENLTTTGVDLVSLPIGTEIRVGREVILRISQVGKECEDRCAIYYEVGDLSLIHI